MRWGSNWQTKFFLDRAQHGGFEAAKGKIELVYFWYGQFVSVWIARFCCFGDGGAARVGEAKYFCDFVETFADCVVARSANNFKVVVAVHVDKLRVASGYDGGYKGEFWLMATEPVGVNV